MINTNPKRINRILIQKSNHPDKKIETVIDIARQKSIPYSFVPKEKFKKFEDFSHQGIIAYVSPIEYTELEDFLEKDKKFKKAVILDGVEDPHNVGSIIRTCVCAGYDAIIIPKHRAALINATVEKASAGSVNYIEIIAVNSIQNTITTLKNNDFWIIASVISDGDNYYDIDYTDMNFALVMGGENSGVSSTVVKNSDFRVRIPMYNDFNSLNVANAASVIIYESIRQIHTKR